MKRQLAALLLTIFALSLTACGETAAESETRTVYAMDTVMNLTVYGENAAAALESAEKELHTLDEAVLSRTAEGSELYALNASNGETVECGADDILPALIETALTISDATEGAFDPTLAPVLDAWGFTKDERRVHNHPIPRMGGLAIFIGFVLSLLIFVDVSTPVLGILLGALIIVVMGAIDDIVNLNAWIKLAGQIVAAVVAIRCGIVFDAISNPNPFSEQATFVLASYLPIPLTLLWIVGCTNAVNLIDGLDGLDDKLADDAGRGAVRRGAERRGDSRRACRRVPRLHPV